MMMASQHHQVVDCKGGEDWVAIESEIKLHDLSSTNKPSKSRKENIFSFWYSLVLRCFGRWEHIFNHIKKLEVFNICRGKSQTGSPDFNKKKLKRWRKFDFLTSLSLAEVFPNHFVGSLSRVINSTLFGAWENLHFFFFKY